VDRHRFSAPRAVFAAGQIKSGLTNVKSPPCRST
jgi:hypothetical protein